MQKILFIVGITVLFGSFILFPDSSEANDKKVIPEILDILHSRGDIPDKKYEELKQKAATENQVFSKIYDNIFHVDSNDCRFKIQIGGRIMIDMSHVNAGKALETAAKASDNTIDGTGVEFRQTRLHIKGLLHERFAFSNEFIIGCAPRLTRTAKSKKLCMARYTGICIVTMIISTMKSKYAFGII